MAEISKGKWISGSSCGRDIRRVGSGFAKGVEAGRVGFWSMKGSSLVEGSSLVGVARKRVQAWWLGLGGGF